MFELSTFSLFTVLSHYSIALLTSQSFYNPPVITNIKKNCFHMVLQIVTFFYITQIYFITAFFLCLSFFISIFFFFLIFAYFEFYLSSHSTYTYSCNTIYFLGHVNDSYANQHLYSVCFHSCLTSVQVL